MSQAIKGSATEDGHVINMSKPLIGQGAKMNCPISGVNSKQGQSVTQPSSVTVLSTPSAGVPGILPRNVLAGSHQKSTSVTTASMNGSVPVPTTAVGNGASVNGTATQQVVPPAIGQQTSEVSPKVSPTDGSTNTTTGTQTLANRKEKTPMCLINELARYNKIQHTYTLTDEQGPAHKKVFFVELKLGDEFYPASGPSIKKAQHAAAAKALEATQYKHPPPKPAKNTTSTDSITPTVRLNALAMKRGELVVYHPIESPHPVFYSTALDYRGLYTHRYHPRYPRIFYVSLRVGQREFIGEGNTRQAARHNAAQKALKVLAVIPITPKEATKSQSNKVIDNKDGEDAEKNVDLLKSEISIVHEIALKRNMHVTFEVIKESGPPHMKTFITRCTCGDLSTEGKGNSKKVSKKQAAEKMLEELQKLPPLTVTVNKTKKNTNRKKNTRNLIKKQKADPDYGVGINPISRLIQIQQAKKEKEPVYMLIAEKGQPRRKEFIMQVIVGDQKCTGEGPNKKLAKRNAAEAMLQMLGYSRPAPQPSKPAIKTGDTVSPSTDKKVTFLDTDSAPSGRQVVPGVLLMPDSCGSSTNMTQAVYLNQRPQSAHSYTGVADGIHTKCSPQTTAVIAKELLDTGSSPTAEALKKQGQKDVISQKVPRYKQLLLYLAEVLGFQVEFTDFPKKKDDYLSLVTVSTNPPYVKHGGGQTIEESQDMAALEVLKALSEGGINIVNEKNDVNKSTNAES